MDTTSKADFNEKQYICVVFVSLHKIAYYRQGTKRVGRIEKSGITLNW